MGPTARHFQKMKLPRFILGAPWIIRALLAIFAVPFEKGQLTNREQRTERYGTGLSNYREKATDGEQRFARQQQDEAQILSQPAKKAVFYSFLHPF